MRQTAEIKKSGSIRRSAGKSGSRLGRSRTGTDATELLAADHQKIKGLFAQFEKAGNDWKMALFEAIRSELRTHIKVEETIFYPALDEIGSLRAKEDIQQSLKDHELADEIIGELGSLTPTDRYFDIKMSELMIEARNQIRFERDEVFKVARTELSEERLDELGLRMKSLKESENPPSAFESRPSESFRFLPVRRSTVAPK
jgi:hypothetical protein